MRPTIRIAQRACEAAKARQVVVVWFDEHGQFAVASYGETKAECSAVKPVCNAVADMLDSGYMEAPGQAESDADMPDRRRGELGGWNEYDKLRRQRDEAITRALAAEKFRETIATLMAIYERQDEPEGQVSKGRVLTAIAETIGPVCSICRRRHGQEVEHEFVQRTEWGAMATCRSCGARIDWVTTTSGKTMPIDHEPSEDGNLVVTGGEARVLREGESRPTRTHKSHFATCVNAAQHRRPR